MMKYSICAIAVLMLFPASAFAMENDGDQGKPCKDIQNLEKKIECRVKMLDYRIDTVYEKKCNGISPEDCKEVISIYAEQLALIEKVRIAIESFPDLTPKERKVLINGEISDAIMTMHENCDTVEAMRQG